ncbi:MAG: hypothetical protein K8R08_03390 [Methanosarcinales archaeon]|nr:hypothetical protein [Methanosarcinales archaeon]
MRKEMRQRELKWKVRDVITDPGLENPKGIYVDAHGYIGFRLGHSLLIEAQE